MSPTGAGTLEALVAAIDGCRAKVGIIGLGYVGLPLALAVTAGRFAVIGYDIDPAKVEALNAERSYIRSFGDNLVRQMVGTGRFQATADMGRLREADVILICVPTPLSPHREPDLSFVVNTAESLLPHLRPGQLIVLESSTYPGTTREVVRPIIERSDLRIGEDLFIAYSPEREDPSNTSFRMADIPKVVGGLDQSSLTAVTAFYEKVVSQVVPVSSTDVAEAVKLTENIFRSVNIALVNELKLIYARMGIDIWEVVEAAKSKPFGYMAFYPGPGLGGHCVPVDPYYLTWKAREFDIATRFIELAGEINHEAPYRVVETAAQALSDRCRKSLNGSRILLVGIAYKKNVEDLRESPALKVWDLLEARGAHVNYYDPFATVVPQTRDHRRLQGRTSIEWDPAALRTYDLAIISTDHDGVDYRELVQTLPLVVDTRNATREVGPALRERVVRA